MKMVLNSYGRALFGPTRDPRHAPKYNDFIIRQDSINNWLIYWDNRRDFIARFEGTFIEADQELKLMLMTQRLST